MKSAFGVDHGIAKSFVPRPGRIIIRGLRQFPWGRPVSYPPAALVGHRHSVKRAVNLTDLERQRLKTELKLKRGMHPAAKSRLGRTGDLDREGDLSLYHRLGTGQGRGTIPERNLDDFYGTKIPRGNRISVRSGRIPAEGMALSNGRGGGLILLDSSTSRARPDRSIIRHERAHLTPKRNPVRFAERYEGDPQTRLLRGVGLRAGREEGRADFLAEGRATPGMYLGTRKFTRGYNEVQQNMTRARQR